MELKLMPDLCFYTTSGCHLCDQAWVLLEPIAKRKGLSIQRVDVLKDPDAEALFAEHIPVVTATKSTETLYWPFTAEDIYRWLL